MASLFDTFAEKRQAAREGKRVAMPPVDAEFADLCAVVFSNASGEKLLRKLRDMTIDAPEDPTASESALRVRAVRSQFVRAIEGAVEAGLKAREKGK